MFILLQTKGRSDTLTDHVWNIKDIINTVEHYGGDIFFNKGLAQQEADKDKAAGDKILTTKEYREPVVEKNKAMCLLKTACHKQYSRLMQSIWDQFSFKIDVYPVNMANTYKLLSSHTGNGSLKKNSSGTTDKDKGSRNGGKKKADGKGSNIGMSCLLGNGVPGIDGRLITHISCY